MKKFTDKSDDAMDKKKKIKENSKRDMALDKKRGVAEDDKPAKGKGFKGGGRVKKSCYGGM